MTDEKKILKKKKCRKDKHTKAKTTKDRRLTREADIMKGFSNS